MLPNISRKDASEAERKIVEKIEAVVEKDPIVMKSLESLQKLEDSAAECPKSGKEKFTI